MGTIGFINGTINASAVLLCGTLTWRLARRCITRVPDGEVGVRIRMERPRHSLQPGFSFVAPGIDRVQRYPNIPRPWSDVMTVHSEHSVLVKVRINMTWSIADALTFHKSRLIVDQTIAGAVRREAAIVARYLESTNRIPDFSSMDFFFLERLRIPLATVGIAVESAMFCEVVMPRRFYELHGALAYGDLHHEALEREAIAQAAARRIGVMSTVSEFAAMAQTSERVDDRALQMYESSSTRTAASTGQLTVIRLPAPTIVASSRRSTPPPPPAPNPPRPTSPAPSSGPGRHRRPRGSRP